MRRINVLPPITSLPDNSTKVTRLELPGVAFFPDSKRTRQKDWSGREDLNLRPPGPEPSQRNNKQLLFIDRRAASDGTHDLDIFNFLLAYCVQIVCQHDEVCQLARCDRSFDPFLM
jgi:hypothetical protein